MGKGNLTVAVSTAFNSLPVPYAHVTVLENDGTVLYDDMCDISGHSAYFELEAPDVSFTLDPSYRLPAYGSYEVRVKKPGFCPVTVHGVQILDTQNTILPVIMEPQPEDAPLPEQHFYLPPPGILIEEPYQKQEEPPTVSVQQIEPRSGLGGVIIPDYITVHLGAPSNSGARNIRVPFREYVKNVTSSEIYSTWPRNALIANIHAIVTFALNRVFTEWYRSRGYRFDITNSTAYDQYFREGGVIYENISQLVDEIFNEYAHRAAFGNPFFTQFCNGTTVTCPGLSQWGTVTLANRGYAPLQILRYYYPDDLVVTASNNITGITETYPGYALNLGSTGDNVRRIQNFLNRIRVNYPAIPVISPVDGVYGSQTQAAVRAFQRVFYLLQDGVVGRSTWNKITSIYVAITKLAELDSEGIRVTIGQNPPNVVLRQGSRGEAVLEMEYILNVISEFYDSVPPLIKDSVFGESDRNVVMEFQRTFGLTPDGIVGPATWNKLYAVYRGIRANAPIPPVTVPSVPESPPFPGTLLRQGSRGESVRLMQSYLNVIRRVYPSIGPHLTEDGIFGPLMRNAVVNFQRQFLLSPDGIIGPLTWNKIVEQYNIAVGRVTF